MARGSEYQKRNEGNATVFDVTPAPGPKFIYLLVIAVIVILIGFAAPGGFKVFMLALGAATFAFGWLHDPRPRAYRKGGSFQVSQEGITSEGHRFAKGDIHRLLLRNGVSDQELVTQYTENANVAAGMAHRARAAKVANALTLESGGKSTLLAAGMDETTAYGLLHDTCRILDFDVG